MPLVYESGAVVMMMFIGTEALVTQLENERSVHWYKCAMVMTTRQYEYQYRRTEKLRQIMSHFTVGS